MSVLVDSNILIYAINDDSPKQAQAQSFLSRDTQSLVITHQNVLECFRVLTHPKFSSPMSSKAAIASITAISDACTIIAPDPSAIYLAISLINQYKLASDQIFDAYLTATALCAGIHTIATDNVRDFQKFTGLNVINPFDQ